MFFKHEWVREEHIDPILFSNYYFEEDFIFDDCTIIIIF